MTQNKVIAAGRRIEAAHVPGNSKLPVLVLLHEGLGSVELWKDFPNELADRTGCAVLTYSRYGNGRSEVLNEARTALYMHEEACGALPQLLDAFGVRDPVLVGHSDGASIALIYAGLQVGSVRAVVAEAPHVFVEDISVRSIAQAREAYVKGDLRDRLARYHRDVDRTFFGWNDIWLDPGFRAWDIRKVLGSIAVPMLLVQGLQDEYGTLAQIDAIRTEAKSAPVDALVLANCGHAPHRDRRAIVLDAIAGFLSGVV